MALKGEAENYSRAYATVEKVLLDFEMVLKSGSRMPQFCCVTRS